MNKEQFINAVRQRLTGLPKADVDRYLDYIREMIDDRMDEGMSEEEAVAMMGSPEYTASQLLMDIPAPAARLEQPRSREMKPWMILLLVLGAPLWLSLLFGAVSAIFAVVIGALGALFGLYCAAGGLVIGGIAMLAGIFAIASMPELLFLLSAGCLLIGIGLLMGLGCYFLTIQLIRLFRWAYGKFRERFSRKGG